MAYAQATQAEQSNKDRLPASAYNVGDEVWLHQQEFVSVFLLPMLPNCFAKYWKHWKQKKPERVFADVSWQRGVEDYGIVQEPGLKDNLGVLQDLQWPFFGSLTLS